MRNDSASERRRSGKTKRVDRVSKCGDTMMRAALQADALAELDVGHSQADEIAAAQFAVDGGFEQGEVARAALVLQAGADRPDLLRFERRLRANEAAEVP